MNTTIESEQNASGLDAPPAKGKRTAAKKAKPVKKVGRAKKSATKPKRGPRQQEGRGDRDDEARQECDVG